jgi:hypothetical protein
VVDSGTWRVFLLLLFSRSFDKVALGIELLSEQLRTEFGFRIFGVRKRIRIEGLDIEGQVDSLVGIQFKPCPSAGA